MRVTSFHSVITISGQAVVASNNEFRYIYMSRGFSAAHIPGRSAYIYINPYLDPDALIPLTSRQ